MSLSSRQKSELEDVALLALGKRSADLANGFRVMGDAGQVAAIYWSENIPGNDVEIALCDIRLSAHYDLRIVRSWIEQEQQLAGRVCNIHKHGSDWPIIGFSYDGALSFLDRCRRLRKGFLANALLNELKAPSPEHDARDEDVALTLARLRPTSKKPVIDLVKLAGVDVECWYKTGSGKFVLNPRSNPAYCYNWSFGGDEDLLVACLWHGELKIDAGHIVYVDNLRQHARKLQEIANDPEEEQEIRNRAQAQARRATALDAALASAWHNKSTVRVIVNEGLHRPADSLGKESSKVEMRKLDAVPWRVTGYDDSSGSLRLVRDSDEGQPNPPPVTRPEQPAAPPFFCFADQYSVVAADVHRTESTGCGYSRSRAVRDEVLTRASGACELCGKRGFTTQSGAVYLETHHVQPLSEGGTDSEDNVVALCPDDHRRAHYSVEGPKIRELLQATLAEIYCVEQDRAA